MSHSHGMDYYYNKLYELKELQAELADLYMSEGSDDRTYVSGYTDLHADYDADDEPEESIVGPIRKGPGKFFNPNVKTPYRNFHKKQNKMGASFHFMRNCVEPGESGYRLPQRMYCVNGATLRTEQRSTGDPFCRKDCPYCTKTFYNHIRGESGARKQMIDSFI